MTVLLFFLCALVIVCLIKLLMLRPPDFASGNISLPVNIFFPIVPACKISLATHFTLYSVLQDLVRGKYNGTNQTSEKILT